MTQGQRYTVEQVIAAVKKGGGYVSQVAEILGCTPQTVHNYRARHKKIEEAFGYTRLKRDDFVENKLMELIKKENPAAVIFYAKTQLRGRGYIEKQDIHITGWQREVLDLIQSGRITAEQARQELGDELATELFESAGIPAIKD